MVFAKNVAVAGFALLCVAGSSRAADDSPEVRSALEELEALEGQIQQRLQAQTEQVKEIKGLERDARTAEQFMLGGDELKKKGRKAIRDLDAAATRDIAAMEKAAGEGRLELESARRGVEIATPLLLHQIDRESAASRDALVLALLQNRHRQQAGMAVEQLLKLEERRSSRLSDRERITALGQRHAAFAGLKLDELRDRHRKLSSRLNMLHASAQQTQSDIVNLGKRRSELNDLMARLSAGEKVEPQPVEVASAPPASALPAPIAPGAVARTIGRASSLPPDLRPASGALAEVPYEDDQSRLPLGTRAGNGAPTVELEIKPVHENASGAEGNRKVFWRARPSSVRAAAAGTVLFSGAFAGYRHLLVVDQGGGWVWVYGNLTSCPRREGDKVASGDVLGDYQADAAGEAEPFFVEARHGTKTVPIDSVPSLDPSWAERLFSESN